MPKVPHGAGLDARERELDYLRREGFGHWEIREGHTGHGGVRIEAHNVPIPDFPVRRRHGWAGGFPIGGVVTPPGGHQGKWWFDDPVNSEQFLTAGF